MMRKFDAVKIVLPSINTCNDDISKEWYVSYRVFNPTTNKLERFRKHCSKGATVKERLQLIQSIAAELEHKLLSGWTPFADNRMVHFNADEKDIYRLNSGRSHNSETIIRQLEKVFEARKPGLRHKTILQYKSRLHLFFAWLQEQHYDLMAFTKFNQTDAEKFLKDINVAPKTRNMYCEQLRSFWNTIIKGKKHIAITNPWADIKSLKVQSKPRKSFSEGHVTMLSTFLAKHDALMLAVCSVVYYTFIRPCQELTNMKIEWISFDDAIITVPGYISKNRKTQVIPIPEQLLKLFTDMELYNYPSHYYVFGKMGPSEKKSSRDYWSKRFTAILRKLKFDEGYSLYCWKHTGNKRAHIAGIPMIELKNQNRHHSFDEMEHYVNSLTASECLNIRTKFPSM